MRRRTDVDMDETIMTITRIIKDTTMVVMASSVEVTTKDNKITTEMMDNQYEVIT